MKSVSETQQPAVFIFIIFSSVHRSLRFLAHSQMNLLDNATIILYLVKYIITT